MSSDGNFHTLEISSTKFDDVGVYKVQAGNELGSVACSCHLVVDGGLRAYVTPFFTHQPEDRDVAEGGTVSLVGRFEAYPAAGVLWHRDGIRLRPSRQLDMRLDSDGSVALIVTQTRPDQAGLYSCTLGNQMGTVSATARVTVKPKKKPEPPPPSSSDEA